MVCSVSLEAVCLSPGYAPTAAACGVSLRPRLWRVRSSYGVLKHTDEQETFHLIR